jgi:hypothetical protein
MTRPAGGYYLGTMTCPEWEHARPAAIVNSEHPMFVTLGFVLTVLGFLLQYLALPGPRSLAAMRKELREARLQERLESYKKSK